MANGLLDNPEQMSMLMTGLGLLGNNRYRPGIDSPMAPIANAAQGGMNNYLLMKQNQQKAERDKQRALMEDLQMKQMQRQIEQQDKQQQWKEGLSGVMAQAQPKVEQFQPDTLQDYLMKAESPYADKILEKQLFPKEKEGFTLGDGQTRFGPDGEVIANVAKAPEKMPSAVQEYEYAKGQGYKGTFKQFKESNARAGASSQSVVNYGEAKPFWNEKTQRFELYQFAKDGSAKAAALPEGVGPAVSGEPTEFEGKAALYYNSMEKASKTLDEMEQKDKPKNAKSYVNKNVIPGAVETVMPGQTMPNVVRGQTRQSYETAAKRWIDSINRVRSGANLPELEYERNKETFFPVYGDSAETVALKAAARKEEEKAMRGVGRRANQFVDKSSGKSDAGQSKAATLADIQETARKSGKSTAEVTKALKAQGYTIGGK